MRKGQVARVAALDRGALPWPMDDSYNGLTNVALQQMGAWGSAM